MFEINLFGPGQMYHSGKALTGFPGQQPCLLFCYLILNRQIPHQREQLAAVFWGDDPTSLARKHLRNTLWRLGQVFQLAGASLDDLVSVDEDYIVFTNEDSYRLDIEEFEAVTHHCLDLTTQELTPEQISLLEAAVDLYKGDLLEGVYEDWCLYERERLRLDFINALIKLMDYHGQHGSYERGIDYGYRILSLDPIREKVHRQMMLLYWLAGDREAALLQYRSCCEILQAELDLEPVQETQHLYETILHSSSLPDNQGFNAAKNPRDNANHTIGEMLQKLHYLKMIVEQTNSELNLLEGMIQKELSIK